MRTLLRLVLLTLILASCAGPGPVATPFEPIAAQLDPNLGVNSSARIEQGFSIGVWEVASAGTTRTLTRQMLAGDETSTRLELVLDFSPEAVSLVDAYQDRLDAELPTERNQLNVLSIVLNNADPEGIVSGRVALDGRDDLDFWVDMDEGSRVGKDLDVPFELEPGFVIDGFSFTVQYIGVVNDSRCPQDVTCVWAGEVTLEFSYVDEDARTSVMTTGIATPNGPAYGESPTIDLEGSIYLEVLDVTDRSATVVIRSSET